MDTERSRQPRRNAAIELLAQEWQVSIEQVEQLYGIELAKLEFSARVRDFCRFSQSGNCGKHGIVNVPGRALRHSSHIALPWPPNQFTLSTAHVRSSRFRHTAAPY